MHSKHTADDSRADYPSGKADPALENGRNEPPSHSDRHTYGRTVAQGMPPSREYSQREPHTHRNREREHVDRGTSWMSVILGWLTAMGAGVILAGIVSGIVAVILGVGTMLGAGDSARGAATESGTVALIGLLIALFLAFLIGGYCAGRTASRSGIKHGLLVAALALAVTVVLTIVGAVVGTSFIDSLRGVTLPPLPADVPQQGLGTILTVTGAIALLMPFIGGALGGMWGARTGRHRP